MSQKKSIRLKALVQLGCLCGAAVVGVPASAQVAPRVQDAPVDRLVDRASAVQVGRYTTIPSKPDQGVREPLKIFARISFPRGQVQTIGDALRYILMRTGYQLADTTAMEPLAQGFLRLPLPESQRTLGPYAVQDMLSVVLGVPWTISVDERTRVVGFYPARGYESPADLAKRRSEEQVAKQAAEQAKAEAALSSRARELAEIQRSLASTANQR